MEIIARLSGENRLTAKIEKGVSLFASLENAVISSDTTEVYQGAYTVLPAAAEQLLPTADKKLLGDVRILGIPTYEVENDAGGKTFIIGG